MDFKTKDFSYLWHPYTPIPKQNSPGFPVIQKAKGVYLIDNSGKKILDGISSWWCVQLGHSHPRLLRAMQKQAKILQHSILGGLSHKPAVLLAEQLALLAPSGLKHSLFAADGSSSVEAALKIALQYWKNCGVQNKNLFAGFKHAYHGDTLGAMAVGNVEKFHSPFTPLFPPVLRSPGADCCSCRWGKQPQDCCCECTADLEKTLQQQQDRIAAVILEPLCQAAGGMKIHPPKFLQKVRSLCSGYHTLLIADEIAVGYGRTGSFFACKTADIQPDLLCIGKSMTGGYLPMSAVLATDTVYETFRSSDTEDRTFYHGHTFCGNPITSALALEVLKVFSTEQILQKLPQSAQKLKQGMQRIAEELHIPKHASCGMIAMLELENTPENCKAARACCDQAMSLGLFIRPLGPVLYLWPPLVVTEKELDTMLDILYAALRQQLVLQ